MDEMLPYRGLKVVDLSQGVAGPSCGMMLALYGADVVKVEPPYGDWVRALGRRYGEHSASSLANNRGKRAVALDLKSPGGQAVVRRLAAQADVFIESFRPGICPAMGLGYDALSEANPGLLYVSVSGYGQKGPYATRPCTDGVAQAFSGLMSINHGADGVPHRVPFLIVDQVTGLHAFQAVQAALYGRRDDGKGRHIDVSLIQASAAMQAIKLVESSLEGGTPEPLTVPSGSYETTDGWVTLALVKESQWKGLSRLIGRPELGDDPSYAGSSARAARADEITGLVAAALATRDTETWLEALRGENILCARIATYLEWFEDPHVKAVGLAPMVDQAGVGPVPAPHMPGTDPVDPADPRQQVPGIGENGPEILADWGFSSAEIEQLQVDKVLGRTAA